MKSKNLVLLTIDYPFGNSEVSFLNQELPEITKVFNKVFIVPFRKKSQASLVPSMANVEFIDPLSESRPALKSADYFFIFRLFLFQLIHSKNKSGYIKNFFLFFSHCKNCICKANELEKFIDKFDLTKAIFYSYWFNEWALVLSILVSKKKIGGFVSRAHGFDLYNERSSLGFIPFREFQLKNVSAVFPISRMGADYLSKKFPEHSHKIKPFYLGTMDMGICSIEKKSENIIVSCSDLIPLKRVHLIPEILKGMKVPVKWVHFGDGTERSKVLEACAQLPSNIKFELRGQVDHEDIMEFFRSNYVHAFINVSETEGIPVSIMEAISFGIPVVATNVGGVKEIVNKETGFLIDKDFDIRNVSMTIKELIDRNYAGNDEIRITARNFWKNYFEASENFSRFVSMLNNTSGDNSTFNI